MFYEIFRFEIKRALNRPAIYFYWLILFGVAFLVINAAGGAFDAINISVSGDNVKLNSPGVINILLGMFSYLGIFITAAICSAVVFKDFRYQTLELMFTTSVSKKQYIFGRFTAAYLLNVLAFSGAFLGIIVATYAPWLDLSQFDSFRPDTYLIPLVQRVLPNLFFVCALFFTLSLLLRSVVVNWVSILGLYILYAIGLNLLQDLDYRNVAALLDPFGITATSVVTSSQSARDMNNETVSMVGVLLYNRLLWGGLAIGLLILCYQRFKFSFNLHVFRLFKRTGQKSTLDEVISDPDNDGMPEIKTEKKTWFNGIKMWWHLTLFEFNKLVKNIYFLLIVLTAVVFLFVASQGIGKIYDTQTYPVTYQVLEILQGTLYLFVFVVIMIFSGEMVWRDRDMKIHEVVSTTPANQHGIMASKVVALLLSVALIQLVMIACGVIFQLKSGYMNFEFPLYFQSVFALHFIHWILLTLLAFFIHTVVNNKYMGHVVLILYFVFDSYFADLLLKHNLLIFGGGPSVFYSDMDGYGFSILPYWIFKGYWLLFALLMTQFTGLFHVIHTETGLISRLHWMRERLNRAYVFRITLLTLLWLGTGSWIYYNTNVIHDFKTSYDYEKQQVAYERGYKQYEVISQPLITNVEIKGDFYPQAGDFFARGNYQLVNTGSMPIDTLLVNYNRFIDSVWFNREVECIKKDKAQTLSLYQLNSSLLPGDTLQLSFVFNGVSKGFEQDGADNISNKNGSFVYNTHFPSLGYQADKELFSRKLRKKYNLPSRPVALSRTDSIGCNRNFVTSDGGFVDFSATLSTCAGQMAVAPGRLDSSWQDNNRAYFHYQSEHKMLHYYALLSGVWDIEKSTWKPADSTLEPVEVSVYYHPGHNYNIENMIRGVKRSLSYYSKHYSPYQFGQLRIVEFPRQATFAQSFPNMIPFSEGIGFIADLRSLDEKGVAFEEQIIDYPFYVTAHEMAHQWWAHQVVAADVEGSQMLMESVTQYSALKAMEEYYGKERMKKFLRDEAFRYLSSRKNESYEERSLALVAPYQSNIYYRKGSLAFYALDDYLGEDRMMGVLKDFVRRYAFCGAPYPTSSQLIDCIKAVTPDTLQYFVEDILEKITLYKVEVDSVIWQRNKGMQYSVEMVLEGEKFYADGQGIETATSMNDWVELGFYNSRDEEVLLKKVRLRQGKNHLTIQLPSKPSTLVIDPYYRIMLKDFNRKEVYINKVE